MSFFLKRSSKGNAFSGSAASLFSGVRDGATSSRSLGEAWATVVLVVTSGNLVADSLSDTTWLSLLSPFAVSVTAVEASEIHSKIAFFSLGNIEHSVTTHGRAGEGSGS